MSPQHRSRRAERAYAAPEAQETTPDMPPTVEAGAAMTDDAPLPPARELLATNTGVRLACTMAAMIGLFAIFLCWAEQESRVIRRFSVQSACLTALHAAIGLAALLISSIMGGVPFIGLMVTLVCLLAYLAVLVLLLAVRLQLMRHAWQGVRFSLPPVLERFIGRYY